MKRLAVCALGLTLSACVLPPAVGAGAATPPATSRAAPPPPPVVPAWHAAGTSIEGRPIETRELGRGPLAVLWIGGIHGDEREGATATEELAAAFAARPDLGERITLTLLRDLNPDGSAAHRRGNARGVDLNRNFPASNFAPRQRHGARPLDQPESRFLADRIAARPPDLVLVCHSTRGSRARRFINHDGPAAVLAEVFARHSGYPRVASDALHATPGSLGSWLGGDLGVPVLTLEYAHGTGAEQAWQETQAAILATLATLAATTERGRG